MTLFNTTSVVGSVVILYFFSFVIFAIIRITTGISIQRFGLSSLRHISYTPKEGIRIDVRGVGLALHRPTFAQPTWISLRLEELCVTVDPVLIQSSQDKSHASDPDGAQDRKQLGTSFDHKKRTSRSQLWKKLTKVKEQVKRIHSQIKWLRMFDLVATSTTLDVTGVGSVSIGSFSMAVHTRRKLLDRGRLFRHKRNPSGNQQPAEWIFTVRSVLLGVTNREPVEVLDGVSVNVHGLLYQDKEGLRDTSIAIKAGRLYLPIDDILLFQQRTKHLSHLAKADLPRERSPKSTRGGISFDDVVDELERPGSREAAIVQTVADSKEFFGSVLRSVQEIQVGLSFIRVSKEIESLRQANLPVVMNMVTHEIGIDLHRMDQTSPAHRMYFSPQDVAHQALVAAVSISISLDDDESKLSRVVYIPMATTTVRTTLPAKTMDFTQERDAAERNSNILFANLVITSPSVDLTPQHLIQLLALSKQRSKGASFSDKSQRHRLISRLLPRATIKFSIHEPVIRFVLPVADSSHKQHGDYDMLISAISSVSLDAESSHASSGDLQYSVLSNFRVVSHKLYYQAASGIKHNLLTTESFELKGQVTASKEVLVVISGSLRNFAVLMVRHEVSKGLYNIVRHFKRNRELDKVEGPSTPSVAFLRKLPSWLLEFHFECINCSFETAGIDDSISKQTRGMALTLESCTLDYVAHRNEALQRPQSRRKTSASINMGDPSSAITHLSPPTSPSRQHRSHDPTDGRRLAIHTRGFQGFIIEALDEWESKPFLSIPRVEVAFSTSRDMQGPIFHVHSVVRAIYVEFSLYRFYSIGVAGTVLKDAFIGPAPRQRNTPPEPESAATDSTQARTGIPPLPHGAELVTIDVKAGYLQVKAQMPHDPRMLLQVYDVTAGRHRWSAPFLRCLLARLHAQSPHVDSAWARVVSMSAIRVDLRQVKRKTPQGTTIDERSIDVSTDFIRLAVPHGLMMYRIFDNFINTVKSMAQLAYRFKTRTNAYILKKEPEGPKHVPRISVRSKALLFEIEDDAFEWKLGNIYRVGHNEQKQRAAREEAFKLKIRKLQDEKMQRSSSRRRAFSSRPSSRERSPPNRRSQSQDSTPRRRSGSRGRHQRQTSKLRYDREGVCALTSSAKLRVDEARNKLDEYNARSWKKQIDYNNQLQSNAVKNIRRMFAGADAPPPDSDESETILALPSRPGLLRIVVSDLHLVIDKPSFPMAQVSTFLHEIGKGMPVDMQYALLIPMSIALDMGEARFQLRDYPLALLHIPALRPGQPPRLPSWSLRTDFVIAEEFRDDHSSRHIKVDIVPKGQKFKDGTDIPGFSIDVRRTVSPVKTFSKPVIDINTNLPTAISWGTAYQPTIQDVMMIIEGFTKPEIDPSDRVGFWDKIRLSFHSRPIINWKGDGDVQLRLKGSRDPYVVTGYGAGFMMCWRNNVRLAIHEDDDPKRFMTVRSGEYVLAIPDYSHHAINRSDEKRAGDGDSLSSTNSHKNTAIFQKVIMKVSGNVQWMAGLVFERDTEDGGRSSDLAPHYNVVLKNPMFLSKEELHDYDAFRGFRSQHIHMSIALAAPYDRDWTSTKISPSQSYNSVHLSPRFFSHFFDWWSLFSGVMSLPIKQGPLWKGPEKSSKKFGRHLATIKYGLLLSPLYIAHVYKHKDPEDYQEDFVSATGLKLRLNSFILDLHQRREYFDTLSKSKSEQTRTSAMKINRAELDFIHADLRAVAASIKGTTADDLRKASDEVLSSFQEVSPTVDMSRFTITDNDFSWIDMDDFVELDWMLPAESNPRTKILPLSFTPRFTYFRQTDHGHAIQGDESRTSPFGNEDTHYCVMDHHNDPRAVQIALVEKRLKALEKQIEEHIRRMGDHELNNIRDGESKDAVKEGREMYLAQQRELEGKKVFLQNGLKRLALHASPGEVGHKNSMEKQDGTAREADPEGKRPQQSTGQSETSSISMDAPTATSGVDIDGLYSAPHDEFASDFNNRFIIHNAQVKWNNSLRNIILRYSHQVSQRRGFVYYMSRRAVKFILDIVDEQAKRKQAQRQDSSSEVPIPATPNVGSPTDEKDEDTVVEDRIQQLLNDAKRFVKVDEAEYDASGRKPSTFDGDADEKIADEFAAMNSYHMRLIAPQIQFQSEKNTSAAIVLTAKGMQLKVISVMDKSRMSDDVSGLIQRRFALDMDGVQIFVTTQKLLSKFIHVYSGNRYGNAPGSSWPPWVSMEAMFDFHLNPFGFQRVVQKTSASLRYEKYNALRLKYNEEVAKDNPNKIKHPERNESRIDYLWVNFPRLRASCDSTQYYAMYIIVLDLLMYSEPLEKTRNERLEKIMLASDFSDLRGAPEIAERLQERIRELNDIKLHFMINAKYLDKRGWQDRIDLEQDLVNCEDELFFIMKAINTSQQRNEERSSQSSGFLRWYLSASEIVWHLMRDKNEPLLEFQLGNAAYERIDNSDGSNHNALEIERIRGWNLLPNAIYPEIIGPYKDHMQKMAATEEAKMLQIHWYMLEAIAGIPVLEEFQVSVHPLKVQLERELGKRLFEYIFPGIGSSAFDGGNFSPLMVKNMKATDNEEDDEEAERAKATLSPDQPDSTPSHEEMRSTSPGAVGRRMQPTYNLNYSDRPTTPAPSQSKFKGLNLANHRIALFNHSNASRDHRDNGDTHSLIRRSSASSIRSFQKSRQGSNPSVNGEDKRNGSDRTTSRDRRGFGLKRVDSNDGKKKAADDVSQMMSRASNYMTLAHVKLNSFVICLSYKGKSERNVEDLHDFVFRMPVLEYRNKTWSNLDLALRLKKDVIRALISHTGAIIGNKLSHHRPGKRQQERLREIAKGSTVLPNTDTLVNTPSISDDQSSIYSISASPSEASPRMSFQSSELTMGSHRHQPSPLLRTGSWSSMNNRQNGSTSHQNISTVKGSGIPTDSERRNGINARPATSHSTDHTGSLTRESTSQVDPLAPIPGILPRPNTSHAGFIPEKGKSLLKDALGRHFSSGGDGGSVLPTIHKGRVRFNSFTSNDRDKGGGDAHADAGERTGGEESDGEATKRKSVLLLGKKVLRELRDR